ncbi:MAG: FtsX-like permease family protein [bacterium]|nr:FtsX-like permease family protein [bacterium]
MNARSLATLLRVELRRLWQFRGRSALVAALISVPVAAIVGGSVLISVTRPTLAEDCAHELGQADLRALAVGPAGGASAAEDVGAIAAAAVEAARAAGDSRARLLWLRGGRLDVEHAGLRSTGRAMIAAPEAFAADGLARGMAVLRSGSWPGAGEIALAPNLLAALDVAVGQPVDVGERALVVSGCVVDPEDLDVPLAIVTTDDAEVVRRVQSAWLIGASDIDAVAKPLWRANGVHVQLRRDIGERDGFEELVIFIVGGIGLLEAALVIAAAFGVSLRRRQREIGLLAATGAAGGGMLVAMLASACVLAIVGGVFGAGIGIGAAAAVHPWLDGWTGRLNGPLELPPVAVLTAVGLGIVTAVLAVWLPARSAARLPIRVALSGRRPVATPSGRWLAVGTGLVGLGAVSIAATPWIGGPAGGFALLGGAVFAVAGFGAASPWVLACLARLAAPLSLPWRIAVRDAGRFRVRDGAAVTAVLAGMSISITVATLLTSIEGVRGVRLPAYRSDWLLVEGPRAEASAARIAAELDAPHEVATWRAVHGSSRTAWFLYDRDDVGGRGRGWLVVADDATLTAMALIEHRDALAADQVLALGESIVADSVDWAGVLPAEQAVRVVPHERGERGPTFVVGAATAERLGLRTGPPPGRGIEPRVIRLDRAVTTADIARARGVITQGEDHSRSRAGGGATIDAAPLHQRPERAFHQLVLLICFLTGLVVVAIATALSASESAADARVLATVGASPGLLVRRTAARTGYLAAIGCAMAVPAGLVPAIGLLSISKFPLPLILPWPEIVLTAVGLPACAWFAAWAFASVVSRWRPDSVRVLAMENA